jgi:hypothetical protein
MRPRSVLCAGGRGPQGSLNGGGARRQQTARSCSFAAPRRTGLYRPRPATVAAVPTVNGARAMHDAMHAARTFMPCAGQRGVLRGCPCHNAQREPGLDPAGHSWNVGALGGSDRHPGARGWEPECSRLYLCTPPNGCDMCLGPTNSPRASRIGRRGSDVGDQEEGKENRAWAAGGEQCAPQGF